MDYPSRRDTFHLMAGFATAATVASAQAGAQTMAMTPTDINLPDVVAEVEAAFYGYEKALVTNDVEALDGFFWQSPHTIRYGGTENLYGFAEIAAFRAGRSPVGLMRKIDRTVITTYGRDFATASTLFFRDSMAGKTGRQMQTWVRTPDGWRVVAAHVSVI